MILVFINQYGYMILYAALTAIVGFLGAQIKKLYDRMTADDTKRKVVETCVKAVEQMYQDLSGREKLEKAKENILAILQSKDIAISEVEMDMLIAQTYLGKGNRYTELVKLNGRGSNVLYIGQVLQIPEK